MILFYGCIYNKKMFEEEKVNDKRNCPKILTYYFPQYHSIPDNNHVFGSDFSVIGTYLENKKIRLT
jgi:hypothetical protein